MKVAFYFSTLAASACAFTPQANNVRASTAIDAEPRREVLSKIAAAAAALSPLAANAAVGESPRYSVFGIIGDGTSYSEGAAYGTDQAGKVYSPYSVYGKAGSDSLYKESNPDEITFKRGILAETQVRLSRIPAYVQKKQWSNVNTELTRYMYETRGAVRGLAKTKGQKEKADNFFKALEATYGSATQRKGEACTAANAVAIVALDDFIKSLD